MWKAHALAGVCSLVASIGAALGRVGVNASQCTWWSIAALLCLGSACMANGPDFPSLDEGEREKEQP